MKRILLPGGVFLLAALALQAAGPELISRRAPNAPVLATGNGPSTGASFAGGGRFVVFSSQAANLVTNDVNGADLDVFRRDLVSGETALVSVGGVGVGFLAGNSYGPSASADAGRIAFISTAASLAAGDTNGTADVFVRDLTAGTTELISVLHGGTQPGSGESGYAVISADGRFVAFESLAADLTGGTDTNLTTDVYLRDLTQKTTVRLSNRAGTDAAGSHDSHSPLLSADAGVVVFRSNATNLTAAVAGNVTDLYVWRADGSGLKRIVLPGAAISPNSLPLRTFNPALSGDGRYLAFRTAPVTSPTGVSGVWWFDLEAGTNALASGKLNGSSSSLADDGSGPVMNGDGRTLAFELALGISPNLTPRIHIWSAADGLKTLDDLVLTLPPGGGEAATSLEPILSPDGTKLAFLTTSPVPAAGVEDGGTYRLFVRTLNTGATVAMPDGNSAEPYDMPFAEFNPEGTKLVLQSEAPLAAGGDANAEFDVFTVAVDTREVTLVSSVVPGFASATPSGFSTLNGQSLSADGRYVLFASLAGDVVADDGDLKRDVFRFDRQTGMTARVSVGVPTAGAFGGSLPLEVSPDGRRALFLSSVSGLTAGDTNTFEDIFLRDISSGTTVLVSAKDQTEESGNGAASVAAMSADGRWVAFESRARDLVPGTLGTDRNVFLRDTVQQRTYWLSRDNFVGSAIGIQGRASAPVISADGQTVGFLAGTTPLPWIYSQLTGGLTALTPILRTTQLALSPDGRHAAVSSLLPEAAVGITLINLGNDQRQVIASAQAGTRVDQLQWAANGGALVFTSSADHGDVADDNQLRDVFHYDVAAARLTRVSQAPGGGAATGGESAFPRVSADGRFVIFRSFASNLVPGDGNNMANVFVRDMATGGLRLLSANPATGAPANSHSSVSNVSADGRVNVFYSAASDLVDHDLNEGTDIFAATNEAGVPVVDADNDGLPDVWEYSAFGYLGQGASDDLDRDGLNNADELLVGSNPADGQSRFDVTLQAAAGGAVELRWQSQPGVTYLVEVTTSLPAGPFETLGAPIVGDGTTKSVIILGGGAVGFARLTAQR